MNYSRTAERIVELAREGICATTLYRELGDVHKSVDRLIKAGILRAYPFPSGLRGRPTKLLFSQGEAPKKKVREKRAHPTPFRDLVLATLGDREMTLRQIADALGRKIEDISGPLMTFCAQGVLVRRRSLGEIDGMTSKSDVFLYRVS